MSTTLQPSIPLTCLINLLSEAIEVGGESSKGGNEDGYFELPE